MGKRVCFFCLQPAIAEAGATVEARLTVVTLDGLDRYTDVFDLIAEPTDLTVWDGQVSVLEYRKNKGPFCPDPAAAYRQRSATSPSDHPQRAPGPCRGSRHNIISASMLLRRVHNNGASRVFNTGYTAGIVTGIWHR